VITMTRRILAALTALLLAGLGAVVLVRYVQAADERARAGEDLVPVLVVDSEVPEGAAAEVVAGRVSTVEVPARLAAPGSTADISTLAGLVTTSTLLPGEQVQRQRFVDPATLLPAGTVAVPPGHVEVSVALEAQRAGGGSLGAGDRVSVQLTEVPDGTNRVSAFAVHRIIPGVLVTRVQSPSAEPGASAAAHLVTLALPPADASDVVLGSTAQALWLSLEQRAAGTAAGSGATSTTATPGDDK
jgi:pilus assembly protein CpaB